MNAPSGRKAPRFAVLGRMPQPFNQFDCDSASSSVSSVSPWFVLNSWQFCLTAHRHLEIIHGVALGKVGRPSLSSAFHTTSALRAQGLYHPYEAGWGGGSADYVATNGYPRVAASFELHPPVATYFELPPFSLPCAFPPCPPCPPCLRGSNNGPSSLLWQRNSGCHGPSPGRVNVRP